MSHLRSTALLTLILSRYSTAGDSFLLIHTEYPVICLNIPTPARIPVQGTQVTPPTLALDTVSPAVNYARCTVSLKDFSLRHGRNRHFILAWSFQRHKLLIPSSYGYLQSGSISPWYP